MKRTCSLLLTILLFLASIAQAQTSRVELRSLSIPGAGSWDFNVYLPPGYDQTTQRYPVVYLFRGAVDEWLDRTEDASRGGRNIQSISDALIAAEVMGPVVLVMPGFTAMTGPATDADYSFILNSLIPFIDQQYRTLPCRWERGVDGFSLGGLHMINLLWRNPERFSSAGSYDGTLSLFNFNLMRTAGETYFKRLRPIQFLLHSAAVAPSNLSINRQVDSLFKSVGINNTFPDLIFSTTSQHNWWNADEHMIRALPLHWLKFQSPIRNVPIQWIASPTGRVAGTIRTAWRVGPTQDSLKTMVEYSRDEGITWQVISFAQGSDSLFDLNTTSLPDGTRYLLRVQVFGDTSYGSVRTTQRFTIDNPVNGAPDVVLLSPQKNETVTGSYRLAWSAEDPEADPVRVSILGSSDNGLSWQTIATDLANSDSYSWNSQLAPNCKEYLIKIRCSDGILTSEITSRPFTVNNQRGSISSVQHLSGHGDGRLLVSIADPGQLTGHTYRVIFDDTTSARKTYSVQDRTKGTFVLLNVLFSADGTEGPSFDGLRLSVLDFPSVVNNQDSTRWTRGKSTLTSQVSVPTISVGSGEIKGVAYPADYEIRVSDQIIDTSSTFLGSTPIPLYYTVWNTTENHRVNVVTSELDNDSKISRFDDIFILEKDRTGSSYITWECFFSGDEQAVRPAAGDVFRIKSVKPLRSGDTFEFNAIATGVASGVSAHPENFDLLQNYPNPFNPSTAISYQLAIASPVKLTVYDLLGRLVATLDEGLRQPGSHVVRWDASELTSGIYFYQLSTPGQTQTRKAVFLK